MKKSNKIYIIGWCYDDGIIQGVYPHAHRNWFNAIETATGFQKILNKRLNKIRHTVIVGVRSDYVNNKTQGRIINKIYGHHYDDTEWL